MPPVKIFVEDSCASTFISTVMSIKLYQQKEKRQNFMFGKRNTYRSFGGSGWIKSMQKYF